MSEVRVNMGEVAQPPGPSRLRGFRADIEGFRALAITMVVLHHAGLAVFGGVDTSFALSGFLVTSLLMREVSRTGKIAFGRFYARRARRLLPLATVVIVTTMLAIWMWAPVFKRRSFALDGIWAALSAVNWRLAAGATDYFAENSAASPFQHFWSLSVEEQFYAVWPVLFLGLFWVMRQVRFGPWVIGGVLTVIAGISIYLSATVTAVAQPWAYFGFHTRAWELAVGALTAVGARSFASLPRPLAAATSWMGLAVIGLGSVMVARSAAIPGTVMLWPVLGTALFIAGGCAAPRFGAEWLLGRALPRFVGRASYGWYLWHWPVLILAPYIVGRTLTVIENLGLVVGSFGLAVLTYRLIEVPVKAKKFLVEIPRAGLVMAGQLVMASGVAALMLFATTVASAAVPRTGLAAYADPAKIAGTVAGAAQATSLGSQASAHLAAIKNDVYPGCIEDTADTVATPCNLGDASGNDQMVLLGSSLAWQWIPAVDQIARQRGLKLAVFTKNSCPAETYKVPAAGHVEGTVQTGNYVQCDTWRQDAYRKIAGLHPRLVVLSSRAEAQATPAAITSSVQYFRAMGTEVVMIGETPRFGFDVPGCLAAHRDALQRCVADRNMVFADTRQGNMAARAAIAAGATVIDPLPWLCTDNRCPPVVDDRIIYFDNHHLSASYVVWLTPLLEAKFPKDQKQ